VAAGLSWREFLRAQAQTMIAVLFASSSAAGAFIDWLLIRKQETKGPRLRAFGVAGQDLNL
jgi:hypothetical protein